MAKKQIVIEVPTDWSAVKYKEYYRFIESIKDQEEDDQLVIEMALQYLCNLSTKDYYKLPKNTFDEVTGMISTLLEEQQNCKVVKSFECMGVTYKLEPNIENMTYGMYLDLSTYSKDLWKNMPIICSILYRPVSLQLKDNYTLIPYQGTNDETVQMFRDLLTMEVCQGLVGFFLSLQTDLLKCLLTYSLKKSKSSLTSQQVEILQKNGVDITQLCYLLEETSQKLMQY